MLHGEAFACARSGEIDETTGSEIGCQVEMRKEICSDDRLLNVCDDESKLKAFIQTEIQDERLATESPNRRVVGSMQNNLAGRRTTVTVNWHTRYVAAGVNKKLAACEFVDDE